MNGFPLLVLFFSFVESKKYGVLIGGRPSLDKEDQTKIDKKHLSMVHDVAAFGTYLLTCDMDRVFFLVEPVVRDLTAFVPVENVCKDFYRNLEKNKITWQSEMIALAKLNLEPGDTIVVYIRSHGNTRGFTGPGGVGWSFSNIFEILKVNQKKDVTFCFFVDCCHSGAFVEQNKPLLEELGRSNTVIVYTSCQPNQGTVTYPVPGGSGGSTQISHFHIYFMTALNGDRDISLNDVYKMIEKEKRSVTTPRRFCRPEGADSRVKISAVLRKPDKFKWYVVGAGPGGFKITFNIF